ncbi:MAG TPA: recombinase family protein [bacterium]|nr:recombinase family protein [bacterium]
MRVALYARVSTSDKDQNPTTQLLPLREFAAAQGWTLAGEFVDRASATDLRGRTQWQAVLQAASRRKTDLVLVWKLDRAFRSVLHASTTLEDLRRWGIGLRSYTEPWADTTSPQGELVFNLLATFAQFERSLIAERVRAGMARAKQQGKRLGRPRAVNGEWTRVQPLIENGTMSRRKAARVLGVGRSTVGRLLAQKGNVNDTSKALV